MPVPFSESTAERAALQWLSAIGYAALSGADAAPGGDHPPFQVGAVGPNSSRLAGTPIAGMSPKA
jgi:hypothetical protein